MQIPVIQKIISSPEAFVERRLKGGGEFFVEEGDRVRPFDFVAEVPRGRGRQKLTAGVGGEVVKLLPGKAVLIKTSTVGVRGVVGKGEDDEGEVRIAAEHDASIELDVLDADCVGDILVGGFVPTLEVFKKAEAVGVKGIVCGGADFAAFQKSTLPTLLVEGFGRPPLDREVAEFLKKVEGRHAFLSPDYQELLVAQYPGGEGDQESSEVFAEIKKGMTVEIFDFRWFGQKGKVVGIDGDMVEAVLDGGDRIEVMGRNVGIIK
jgi:hypothetical protein